MENKNKTAAALKDKLVLKSKQMLILICFTLKVFYCQILFFVFVEARINYKLAAIGRAQSWLKYL